MQLGRAVKITRIRAGLKQDQLAVAAGCSIQTVGFIEQGRRTPSMRTLDKLAAALNTTASAILAEAETL